MSTTITFVDDRYYESPTGQYWPRVTTILEAFPKGEGFYSWMKSQGKNADDILTNAGDIGTRVHIATQDYDSGIQLFYSDFKQDEWILINKYASFTEFCKPDILVTEKSMISDNLKYGGTLDRIVEIDGIRILLDIKTSNYIYKQHWCQIAAYRALLKDQLNTTVDAVGILHLRAKTRKTEKSKHGWQGKGWTLEIKNNSDLEFEIFQKVYTLWLYDQEDYAPGVKTFPATLQKLI